MRVYSDTSLILKFFQFKKLHTTSWTSTRVDVELLVKID